MKESLESLVNSSANLILLLNFILVIYSLYRKKSMYSFSTKWLLLLFLGTLIYSLVEQILANYILVSQFIYFKPYILPIIKKIGIKDFNFTAPISYLIKFIFLGLFFRDLMAEKFWKTFFQWAVWVLVVFELVQVFVFKSYQGYDSLSSTVKNVFIIGGVGLFLYKFYHSDTGKISLVKNPYFWISLGLILPAFAEFFLEFIFTKLYQTDLEGFYKYYLVRNASQIIGFLLLIMGIWQAKYLRFLPKEY